MWVPSGERMKRRNTKMVKGLCEKLLKIKFNQSANITGSVCSLSSDDKLGERLTGTHLVTYAEV